MIEASSKGLAVGILLIIFGLFIFITGLFSSIFADPVEYGHKSNERLYALVVILIGIAVSLGGAILIML